MERTSNEKTVGHAWIEKGGFICKHLGDCSGVQHVFSIAFLYLSLFMSSFFLNIKKKSDLRSTYTG